MTWRDMVMREASFRGVPFVVQVAELEGGRRVARHEYPGRDVPYVEDLGRASRVFPVEAIVVGEDYIAKRDALLSALEEEGAGELIHPLYGTRSVICTSFRVRESSEDGGCARLGLTFEESEVAPRFPSSVPAADDALGNAADAADEAALADFLAVYNTDNQPVVAIASLSATVESAKDSIDTAFSPLVTTAQGMASFRRALENLVSDVDALVRTPAELYSIVDLLIEDACAVAELPERAISACLDVYGFVPSVDRPDATTSTREIEQANYDALYRAIRLIALLRAARLAPSVQYLTYEQAIDTRDRISDALDIVTNDAEDATYEAIDALRSSLTAAVPEAGSDLPRIVTYLPSGEQSSLAITWELYGSLDREQDVIDRNVVLRPGFVPGNGPLKVLSHG